MEGSYSREGRAGEYADSERIYRCVGETKRRVSKEGIVGEYEDGDKTYTADLQYGVSGEEKG